MRISKTRNIQTTYRGCRVCEPYRSFALDFRVLLSLHLHALLLSALECVGGGIILLSLHLHLEGISCGSLLPGAYTG